MTDQQKQRFEALIEEGYEFTSSTYLEKGWKIFSQYFAGFAGFGALVAILELILYQIGMIPGFLVASLLIGPVATAGLYWVAQLIDRSQAYEPKDFLYGINHFFPLVVVNLLMMIITALVVSPAVYALYESGFFSWYQEVLANPITSPAPPELPARTSTVVFLNFIPLIYLYVSYLWAIPLVLFYQASPWQALESSRRLISRKWFAVFRLFLVIISATIFVAMLLGMISSLNPALNFISTIGLAIVNGLVMCIFYAAFSDVTAPLEDPDVEEELLDHFIS